MAIPSMFANYPFPPINAMDNKVGTVCKGQDDDIYIVKGDSLYRWWEAFDDKTKTQFDPDVDAWLDEKNEEELHWEEECQACFLGVCDNPGCYN